MGKSNGTLTIKKIDFPMEQEKMKRDLEREIYYLTEENMLLSEKIRIGKEAERELEGNRKRLEVVMERYLEMEEG